MKMEFTGVYCPSSEEKRESERKHRILSYEEAMQHYSDGFDRARSQFELPPLKPSDIVIMFVVSALILSGVVIAGIGIGMTIH